MTTTTTLGLATAAVLAADQTLTGGQNWTLLALLAFVIGGCFALAKTIVDRFVAALDRNTAVAASVTTKLSELVTELRELTVHNAAFQSRLDADRERAVAEIKSALDRVPDSVVNELQRRRGQ